MYRSSCLHVYVCHRALSQSASTQERPTKAFHKRGRKPKREAELFFFFLNVCFFFHFELQKYLKSTTR